MRIKSTKRFDKMYKKTYAKQRFFLFQTIKTL
jgi:hypothetical protein